MAEDDEALDRAVYLWNTWSQSVPEHLNGHDPRMLTPLIQRVVINGLVEPETPGKRDGKNTGETCEMKLKNREKELRRTKKSLGQMKKQIGKLETQIESLEAIHRNIQEKKKELH